MPSVDVPVRAPRDGGTRGSPGHQPDARSGSLLRARTDEETERTVDPLDVVTYQGQSYLQAWCHLAENRRFSGSTGSWPPRSSRRPPTSIPRRHPRPCDIFQPAADNALVTLRLAPQARWVAEYYPVAAAREMPDGGLERAHRHRERSAKRHQPTACRWESSGVRCLPMRTPMTSMRTAAQ